LQPPSLSVALPRALPPPRWAGPAARRYVQRIGGMWIHWVQAGSGSPVLLLHGYSGSAYWWTRNLQPLARAHTVYALDLPGFGASRMPAPYTFARTISLVTAWMATNAVGPATIVGHSMGGQVAMLLAAQQPEQVHGLVLIAPAGLPFTRNLLGIARGAFLSRSSGDIRFTPIVVAGALRAGPRILWQAVRQIQQIDVRPRLVALALPTLILWGDRDRLLPVANAAILAAALPGAEVRIIPGEGHNVFFDRADLVNEAILSFIQKVESGYPDVTAPPS
jgi:pimeloyl-ACP methyl ester carboxylesterase